MFELAPSSALARSLETVGPYRVTALEGMKAFRALQGEWDDCVREGPVDVPFVSHGFLSAWLDAFAPEGNLRVVLAREPSGRAAAFAPFLEVRRAGATFLESPSNDHSSRFEWALGHEGRLGLGAIWAHLRDRMRWDALLLRDIPREGPTSRTLETLALSDGHLTGRWSSLGSPFVPLREAPVETRCAPKFRANLRRRGKRLQELGRVSIRRVDELSGLESAFAEFLRVEASGWKGREGSAIARDPRLTRFYLRLSEYAARQGELAIRSLELDGRAVAVHLGLRHRDIYYLPKTGYDEELASVSPGQLLTQEVLAECQARGLEGFDFLGPDMPWKRDWAPRLVPHDWLYIYRPSIKGRAMHRVKHGIRPKLKEIRSWLSR